MARRSVVVRTPLRQGQRRQNVWIGVDLGPTVVPASAKVLLGLLDAAALGLRPFTIIRTRLFIHIESDQTAASEVSQGVFGEIVVSDQAVAAGAASVPGPVTNPDAPFIVYEPFVNSFLFGDGTGFLAGRHLHLWTCLLFSTR